MFHVKPFCKWVDNPPPPYFIEKKGHFQNQKICPKKYQNSTFNALTKFNIMETLLKLEESLEKRYSIFNKEDAFIEVTKDYLSINCYSYMFEYVERYFDWLVNFCVKFLKRYNYKGFVYIFGYNVEIK